MRHFVSLDSEVARIEAYAGAIVLLLLVSGGALYLVLRQAEARGERRDPQLGLKAALQFFYSVSILMVLTGLTVVAADLFDRDATLLLTRRQRAGIGVLSAGLVFGLLHWLMLRLGTNDSQRPAARRMFAGWRLAIHSLLLIAAVAFLLADALQQTHDRSPWYRTYYVVLCIWGPSWLVHLLLVWWYGVKDQPAHAAVSWDAE